MNLVDLDKIVVVGGGSAGLISALMLKKTFVTKLVHVIKSDKTGIIGVGESSTEHIMRFMRHIGISEKDLILNCGATYKGGIYFQGFNKDDFMHFVGEPYNYKHNNYSLMYGQLIGYKKKKYNLYPEFYNNAKEKSLFKPINYMGGKSGVVLKQKDFSEWFVEENWN